MKSTFFIKEVRLVQVYLAININNGVVEILALKTVLVNLFEPFVIP